MFAIAVCLPLSITHAKFASLFMIEGALKCGTIVMGLLFIRVALCRITRKSFFTYYCAYQLDSGADW